MGKYIAEIYMTKHSTKDNYHEGCSTDGHTFVYDERFLVHFNDTKDLIEKLCEWTEKSFAIDGGAFLKHTNNEIENNRFMYSQNEDADANLIEITEKNPDGYLCDYDYYVETVCEVIEYTFDNIQG